MHVSFHLSTTFIFKRNASGIMTYDGLESCILNTSCFENESGTSRGDGCITDSLDEDESSCSSSKDAFGSFSSQWDMSESPQHFYVKEKPFFTFHSSDVETMKETFANLLLGEDVTGGKNGLTTALALSNAITNLASTQTPHFLIKIVLKGL